MVHRKSANRKPVYGVRRARGGERFLALLLGAGLTLVSPVAWAQQNPQVEPVRPVPTLPGRVMPQAAPVTQPVRPGPPAPPPAGKTPAVVTAPPPVGKPFPLEVDLPARQTSKMELAGYRGGVFLRDSSDDIRFHVRGRLHLDFHSFLGSGKDELEAEAGAPLLSPRLVVRRARIEVGADLFRRWFALFGVEFGSQPLTNPTGEGELPSAPPGQPPTAFTSRFASLQTQAPAAFIANAFIDYTFLRQLHLQIGQHQAPFSMENRTPNTMTTWMERNMAIRSFVVPNGKEMGLVLWGDVNDVHTVGYELGVFLGDGPNRPQVDGYPDFIGRIFARPWARSGQSSAYEKVQIGLSAQRGMRDPKFVGYDYPAITSAFGWALWDPRYRDAQDRLIRVLPSGGQTRIGGELRVPVKRFDIRAEAYWVDNGTREAVDGFQLQNTERFGRVRGLGYYVQVSAWPFGDAFVVGDPGFSRPPKLDLTKNANTDVRGLEVAVMFAGADGSYDGAARGGSYDVKTPGAPGGPSTTISVHEIGVGATYWHSQFVRASLNYLGYHTVGSDTGENLAVVPSNLIVDGSNPARATTWHHEVGMRLGVTF